MKNILIIGMGEVGKSIEKLYDENTYNILNIDADSPNEVIKVPLSYKVDVMNICFSYSKKFTSYVKDYILFYKPKLTIIHSTVPFLTTDIIYNATKAEIVHSPVIGVHPKLTESIQTFEKIIAGYTKTAVKLAREHFSTLGIKTVVYDSPEETELAKMLSTTYYGLCIRYMQDVHKLCEKFTLNFDQIYTKTNKLYNKGYSDMNMSFVNRPVLKYMGEKIKGHCIRENSKLLINAKMIKKFAKIVFKEDK